MLAVVGCLPRGVKSETEWVWEVNGMYKGLGYYLSEVRSPTEQDDCHGRQSVVDRASAKEPHPEME